MIIETQLWTKLTGYGAVTIWPFIFINDKTNEGLIAHEKVHLKQQLRGWLIFFYIKYFYYQWRYGYENNPYEIEAREISGHR
jgi:hypothetical protein